MYTQELAESTEAGLSPWNPLTRVAFRFASTYLILYHLDFFAFMASSRTRQLSRTLWRAPMLSVDSWIAVHVFHMSPAVLARAFGGNTDTPIAYVHVLVLLVIAALSALLWSLMDRKRRDYRRMHQWVRLLVRYSLAVSLFTYGFTKVFPSQFAPVWLYMSNLIQPFGDKSPAGLLWSFMGYSTPYQIFGGIAEVVPAVLLLFPKTTLLGSLLAIAVTSNVAILNFSYDVNLKLFSFNLVLAAVFLAMPDIPRLTRFLLFNKPTEPAPSVPISHRAWIRNAATVLKIACLGWFFFNSIPYYYGAYQEIRQFPKPALYGTYDVEQFTENGTNRPPLLTDAARWKRVVIDYFPPTGMKVQMMDDSFRDYNVEYDKAGKSVTVFLGKDKKKYVLNCSQSDADHVFMQGSLGDDSLVIELKRIDPSKFLLLSRGFRWMSESQNSLIR